MGIPFPSRVQTSLCLDGCVWPAAEECAIMLGRSQAAFRCPASCGLTVWWNVCGRSCRASWRHMGRTGPSVRPHASSQMRTSLCLDGCVWPAAEECAIMLGRSQAVFRCPASCGLTVWWNVCGRFRCVPRRHMGRTGPSVRPLAPSRLRPSCEYIHIQIYKKEKVKYLLFFVLIEVWKLLSLQS